VENPAAEFVSEFFIGMTHLMNDELLTQGNALESKKNSKEMAGNLSPLVPFRTGKNQLGGAAIFRKNQK
jgi:hypothetical protein